MESVERLYWARIREHVKPHVEAPDAPASGVAVAPPATTEDWADVLTELGKSAADVQGDCNALAVVLRGQSAVTMRPGVAAEVERLRAKLKASKFSVETGHQLDVAEARLRHLDAALEAAGMFANIGRAIAELDEPQATPPRSALRTLLDRTRDKLRVDRQAIRTALRLIKREANGEHVDADELGEALKAANMSVTDAQAERDALIRWRSLEATAKAAEEARIRMSKADAAVRDFEREADEAMSRIASTRSRLNAALAGEIAASQAGRLDEAELHSLRGRYAWIDTPSTPPAPPTPTPAPGNAKAKRAKASAA